MNKEMFLRDLRSLLSDLPAEEREQAINYYEDYFADAGVENEQQVIQELGSPLDIANQIKSTTQDNIEYGKGNAFHNSSEYPDIHTNTEQSQNSSYQQTQNGQTNYQGQTDYQSQNNSYYQSQGQTGQQATQKKSWSQDSSKVTLLIILALLAIPVGIPVITTIASVLFGIFITVVSIVFAMFVTAIALVFSGIVAFISGFGVLASAGIASTILLFGVGLILASVGILLFWFMVFFCRKFFPALFSTIEKACGSLGKEIKKFFS